MSEGDLRGHAGEAATTLRGRAGQSQVLVDNRDLIGAPPELARPFGQVILPSRRFAIPLDLGGSGLSHIHDRGAAQVGGLDFRLTHRRPPSPVRVARPAR